MPAAPPPPPPVSREPGFVLPAASHEVAARPLGRRHALRHRRATSTPCTSRSSSTARCCCCPRASACGRRCGAPGSLASPAAAAPTRCTRSIRRARCSSTGRRPRALGDLFAVWGQRLAPRRLLSFSGRVQAFRNGREWRGDPRRDAVAAARRDRARDRRLRAAARALPLPGGPVMGAAARRSSRSQSSAPACGGGGGSPAPPTVAPAQGVQARLAGPDERRQARYDDAAFRRAHARRQDPDAVPHGRGAAHRRAPDHRARRPLVDRPQAPADPRERPPGAARRRCRAPAATTCSSTSTRADRRAAELPAHA